MRAPTERTTRRFHREDARHLERGASMGWAWGARDFLRRRMFVPVGSEVKVQFLQL